MRNRRISALILPMLCLSVLLIANEVRAEDSPEPGKDPAFLSWRMEPMAGSGGLFSRGAGNVVLLTDIRVSYFPGEFWRLGVMHSLRSLPWERERSLFHLPGLEGEIRPLPWLGCGVGVGPALAYLQSGKAREFATGLGWTLHVSSQWLPQKYVGIGAKVLVQQMFVRRSLYSALGVVAGPVLAW